MNLKTETLGAATILCASGNLDAAGAPGFEEQGRNLLRGGAQRLVLDLAGVEYISSAGLRSILAAGKKTKVQQGRIVLCSLKAMVREVFEISGFASLFSIFDSRDAAVAQL